MNIKFTRSKKFNSHWTTTLASKDALTVYINYIKVVYICELPLQIALKCAQEWLIRYLTASSEQILTCTHCFQNKMHYVW
jgi:hypothetical protein